MSYIDNVRTELHAAITSTTSTTIQVVKADTTKYNDIPASGQITIRDSLSAPSKIPETITYTGRTDNTTYWTLTGVTRGAEGTTANTWLAGHPVYQAMTAQVINGIYDHTQPSATSNVIDVDTGALTGATVISDVDINIETNTHGHVTGGSAVVGTREATLADFGSVGDGALTEKNFTTALKNKLDGIEASADVTDTANVVNALTAGSNIAIAANGTISGAYSVGDAALTEKNFTAALKTKLDGIFVANVPTTSVSGNVVTISNYNTYTNPIVTVGYNKGVCDYTQDNGVLTFSGVTLNNNKIGISVSQNGGLGRTAVVTLGLGSFRYYRVSGLTSSNGGPMLMNLRFNVGASAYPANMTSNSAPSPYQAQASHFYSGYPAYAAFDSSTGSGWWLLGQSASVVSQATLDVDMGSSIAVTGLSFRFGTFYSSTIKIEGSNTSPFSGGGGFTGEQTVIYEKTGIASNTTYYA